MSPPRQRAGGSKPRRAHSAGVCNARLPPAGLPHEQRNSRNSARREEERNSGGERRRRLGGRQHSAEAPAIADLGRHARAAQPAMAKPPAAAQPPRSNLKALHQRTQREADDQKERALKRVQTDKLLRQWHARTGGDVYAMLASCKLFTDLFATDPLGGAAVARGDAAALKKAWHKLATRLHPDRQRGNPTATQVLAEECFKTLTLAYQKEADRLGI